MSIYRVVRRLFVVAAGICALVWASHGAALAVAGNGSMSCSGGTGAAKAGIEISSFSWGTTRSASTGGSIADRESSTPSVSEIVITKTQDSSSPNLYQGLASAHSNLGTCTIKFVKGNQPNAVPYLTITLTNTLISGWSQSGGSDRPTESLTLNFTKIQFSDKIEGGTGTVPTNILKPTPSPSPKPKT